MILRANVIIPLNIIFDFGLLSGKVTKKRPGQLHILPSYFFSKEAKVFIALKIFFFFLFF